MIESFNTLIADSAVPASRWTNDFAFWTEISWVDVSEQIDKRLSSEWFQSTGIFATCIQETQKDQDSSHSVSKLSYMRSPMRECRKYDKHVNNMHN